MGDYTKLIINCSVKKMTEEEIEIFKVEFLDNVYIGSSAYHCGGEILEFVNSWHHRTDISFITQLKYSRGLDDFIDWLRPHVTDGMGEDGAFGLSFTEYQRSPTIYYKD